MISSFNFFSFNCNFDFFLPVMTNNQTKCGIIYKKIAMQVGDDEQMTHYEWLKMNFCDKN